MDKDIYLMSKELASQFPLSTAEVYATAANYLSWCYYHKYTFVYEDLVELIQEQVLRGI